jgi:hypothetical protein
VTTRPPQTSRPEFAHDLREFENVVGKEWTFSDPEDLAASADAYSPFAVEQARRSTADRRCRGPFRRWPQDQIGDSLAQIKRSDIVPWLLSGSHAEQASKGVAYFPLGAQPLVSLTWCDRIP